MCLINSFLSYSIREKNKLDSGIRNAETYASFQKMPLNSIRPTGNSTSKIYDTLEIKLLTRLSLGFRNLTEHKFRHNFADSLNPFVSVLWKLSLHFIFFYAVKTIPLNALFTELKK